MGYVIELESLEDLLDHADYCSEIFYKCEKIDDGVYNFKIKAGKVSWEGLVRENDEIYERLMQVLEVRGKRVRKVWKSDEFAERWRE